jgi:hypothetical protein
MIDYGMLSVYVLLALLMGVVAICKKEVAFGIKRWFFNLKYKGNIGYHFRVNAGSDSVYPDIIDLSKETQETQTELIPITNQQFQGFTFLKTKFFITDKDNILMSYGLYKHDCDEKGKPKFHAFKIDDEKTITTAIPVLTAGKTSCTVSGDLIKKTFLAAGLSSAVDDFIQKNKMLLIVGGAAAVLALVAAYFGYVNNNMNAEVLMQIGQLKGQVGTIITTNGAA